MLQLPLREIDDRFTKSEIAMFAWRSQEQYWQFKAKTSEMDTSPAQEEMTEDMSEEQVREKVYDSLDRKPKKKERVVGRRKQYAGKVPEGLPSRFYNKEGEIDLRQVTGDEAYKYFAKIGIPLPVINRMR